MQKPPVTRAEHIAHELTEKYRDLRQAGGGWGEFTQLHEIPVTGEDNVKVLVDAVLDLGERSLDRAYYEAAEDMATRLIVNNSLRFEVRS